MAEVDLHCHTLASDGSLTPTALVNRAYENGVRYLAVTDHDTCSGLAEARNAANQLNMTLINGIELSSQWRGMGIHIVGLDFDPEHSSILHAVDHLQAARISRAEKIGVRLDKLKMPGVYPKAESLAKRPDVGRPHMAQAMVLLGYVKTEVEAFDRFLGAGKVGDIKMLWPEVAEVVKWIREAGGVPVLAHPGKYNMTWSKLRELIEHFVKAGGQAIEVSYSGENPDRLRELTRLANHYDLKVSAGSDFHNPNHHWTELGRYPPIKGDHQPVWQSWIG